MALATHMIQSNSQQLVDHSNCFFPSVPCGGSAHVLTLDLTDTVVNLDAFLSQHFLIVLVKWGTGNMWD